MDKLPNYNGSIDLISGLRPKNNGDFPLMQAHDVQVTETQRLDEMFESPESWLPVYNGENEGGAEGGTGGSSTVTRKVTLAELVALCTLENAGMLVNISANLSNMPNVNDGDLGGLLSTYGLTSLQADINYQETDNGNVFLISSAKTYSNGGTLFGLFVRLVTANGQIGLNSYQLWGGSGEETLASGELTDEYFNFYVIEKTVTGSSSSGGGSTAGVPQYNLTTVIDTNNPTVLNETDTLAFAELLQPDGILKFQNIGVILLAEESVGHQAFVGLSVERKFTGTQITAIIFKYQNALFNISLTADLTTYIITASASTITEESASSGSGVEVIIIDSATTGTLSDADYQKIVANPQNIVINQTYILHYALSLGGVYFYTNSSLTGNDLVTFILRINEDKTWELTTSNKYVIEKVKVTLAELKTLLTEENAGAMVTIVPTSTNTTWKPEFPPACINYYAFDNRYEVKIQHSAMTSFNNNLIAVVLNLDIYVNNVNGELVTSASEATTIIQVNSETGLATFNTESTSYDEAITDDNFDFYIYK